ncbi:MAG TPA: methionyl-tRNA formyltransferase [Armatimonadota bacterium]|nr:methionyl-tRNA formyltransferase [Armatimonadota bacterium]
MRILFIGTGGFAIPMLKALLASKHQVIGVVTQPDRPAGRGLQMRVSAVKQVALQAGVPIHQPEKVRSEEFISLVRELSPDAIVLAAFGQIIPKSVLDIPRFGSLNVHASILPKYRGAAPVHHALFNGETRTGVSTMLMDPGLDTGPILLQQEVEIRPADNEGTLEARLAEAGAALLLETLERLGQDAISPRPQDDAQATYAPSVKREECVIRWEDEAQTIVNRIRGCTPRPGAYTVWRGSPLKVWSSAAAEDAAPAGEPGEVLRAGAEGVLVRAGHGAVLLVEVQPENRKRMHASEFARGYGVVKGVRLA